MDIDYDEKTATNVTRFANSAGQQHEIQFQEKVLFGSTLQDRRHIVDSNKDNRLIIKCIGRIRSDWHSDAVGYGTGTVFQYGGKDSRCCWVITCAHNVVKKDENEPKEAETVYFERIETNSSNDGDIDSIVDSDSKVIETYKAIRFVYHPKYTFGSQCEYDLALLAFEDVDLYYKNIFYNSSDNGNSNNGNTSDNRDKIKLMSIDLLPDISKFILTFELYGFPFNDDRYSQVIDGCMYGMDAKSYEKKSDSDSSNNNNNNSEMYVRINNGMFYYNALDTEGGQSGSSLFTTLNKDNYAIVGVHTGGSKCYKKNWSVALTKEKIEWIGQSQLAICGIL